MTQRGWALTLAGLGLVAVLVLAWLRPSASPMAEPGAPAAAARRCISPTPQALQALRQGAQRLVVVVTAFQPPQTAAGGLVVSLVGADGVLRHELSRIAVHPLQAFSASEPARSQRFLVSLEPVAHLLEAGRPLCVEVGFANASGQAAGGWADFGLELTP